ncbi:MAG: putative transport system permease protein [Subtercola sp.]|nr:putative transport system permease protein [Subtercola sp.]
MSAARTHGRPASARPLREHAPSILVAALSAAFGVSLLETVSVLTAAIAADDVTGASETVALILPIAAVIFLSIAVYVGAIVTANSFQTIIAGRTRAIALRRLLGSEARSERASVTREGLLVGVAGSLLGAFGGTVVTILLVATTVAAGVLPDLPYTPVTPVVAVPVVAVALTTWAASWVGSRGVLAVTPMQAIAAATPFDQREAAGGLARGGIALALFLGGDILLAAGVFVGLGDPRGVLVALVGGIVSFLGVIVGANRVMPIILGAVGRLFGCGPTARLAARNAVRDPERSARSTVGLLIGVTLITTFAVATGGFQQMIHAAEAAQPEVYEGVDRMLGSTVVVFSALMGFSALIAAVGLVNTLSLSVLQRIRELGLLRALGFTRGQLRRMIVAESAALTLSAVVLGLALGTLYGWAGAQSLLGGIAGSPGLVVPTVPLLLLAAIAIAAALLTLLASLAPARRATRVSPTVALAAP